jgi:hypothetical protein
VVRPPSPPGQSGPDEHQADPTAPGTRS